MQTMLDCLVIGAGMAGLLAAIKLKEQGLQFVIVEKADRLGGTWRENTYPGLTCDVPSHAYTYSFAPNPNWSRFLPPGSEIFNYFQEVAERYAVLPEIQFNTEIADCRWQQDHWQITAQDGRVWNAKSVVAATGVLHYPRYANIDGLDNFTGHVIHSARWDHSVALDGKRIGVIGNGSTGVQIVSALADRAHMRHFQRTAQWIFPVENPEFSAEQKQAFRDDPELLKFMQQEPQYLANVERFTQAVTDANSDGILEIEAIARANLENSVSDPVLREKLTPNYRAGCKRLIYSPDYYQAIQHPNSQLITENIVKVTDKGIVTDDGREHALDIIVLATGFHANRFMQPMTIEGVNGTTLASLWERNPTAYYAVTLPEMPNFFMLNGPTGPVGNFSLIDIAEAQWGYIEQLLQKIHSGSAAAIYPSKAALQQYDEQRKQAAKKTVFGAGGCQSWYLDADGIPNTWPWSQQVFFAAMKQPIWEDYHII